MSSPSTPSNATTVTLIAGDSIGPELARHAQRVVAAAGVRLRWDEQVVGHRAFSATGEALPAEAIRSIRTHKVALKGRLATPYGAGYESPNVRLRKELQLFAAVRPVKVLPGLKGRYDDVDFVLIRESTEDVYAGIEHQVVPGVVQSIKVTTRTACERVIRFAFEYTRSHGRDKLTLIHKANIMKRSDGLFLACGREIAADYPDVTLETLIADNACMQLVRDPSRYDVLVTQNLFGDLLGDLGAGLVGGISNVYGALCGAGDVRVFEVIHGIADDLVGKDLANPLPWLRPTVAMLAHLGHAEASERIDRAIGATLEAGVRTADSGGTAKTSEMVDAIVSRIAG